MFFKGVQVDVGDFVSIRTADELLNEIEGVVVHMEMDALVIFNVNLAVSGGNGRLVSEQVRQIKVLLLAKDAIPLESDGKKFTQHQRVSTMIRGQRLQGKVFAALQGFLFVRQDHGEVIAGGASGFSSVD